MIAWQHSYTSGDGLYFAKPSRKIKPQVNKNALKRYETLLSPIKDILACYDFFIASLHLHQDVSFRVILLFLASLPIDLAKLVTNLPESLASNDIFMCFSTEIVVHV